MDGEFWVRGCGSEAVNSNRVRSDADVPAQVCRKLGIHRWPFQALKPIERRLQALQEKQVAAYRLGLQPAAVVMNEIAELQARREQLMSGGGGDAGDSRGDCGGEIV